MKVSLWSWWMLFLFKEQLWHKKVSHKRQYIDILLIKQLLHLLYRILFILLFFFIFVEFNLECIFLVISNFNFLLALLLFCVIGGRLTLYLSILLLVFNTLKLSTELLLNNFLRGSNISSFLFNSDFNNINLFLLNNKGFSFILILLLLFFESFSIDFSLFNDVEWVLPAFLWKFILLYKLVTSFIIFGSLNLLINL